MILLKHSTKRDNSHKSRHLTRDDSLAPDVYAQVLIAVTDALLLILVPDARPVTQKAHLLSGKSSAHLESALD